MKYCEECFNIVTGSDECVCGSHKLKELKPQSSVKIANVKGSLRAIAEPALKEKGIPCEFFNPEKDIYTQYNPKVTAETDFSLLVPFEFYNIAFDVCVGLGLSNPEDKIEVDEATQTEPDGKSYQQYLEEANAKKPKILGILGIILFIVLACLAIWGVDIVAALIKYFNDLPIT